MFQQWLNTGGNMLCNETHQEIFLDGECLLPGAIPVGTGGHHSYPNGPISCGAAARSKPGAQHYFDPAHPDQQCLLPCTPMVITGWEPGLWIVYALWLITTVLLLAFTLLRVLMLGCQGANIKDVSRRERGGSITFTDDAVGGNDSARNVSSESPWSFGESLHKPAKGNSRGGEVNVEMKDIGVDADMSVRLTVNGAAKNGGSSSSSSSSFDGGSESPIRVQPMRDMCVGRGSTEKTDREETQMNPACAAMMTVARVHEEGPVLTPHVAPPPHTLYSAWSHSSRGGGASCAWSCSPKAYKAWPQTY